MKSSREELAKIEVNFNEQINELIKGMGRKFADKQQNKKEHADMERQIRNLYDIITAKESNDNEDDAMLSKKPFAGM